MTKRDIEDVIDELVGSSLAPQDNDPRVLVDDSLWSDIGRVVEVKPQPMATGTIPPPIGAYCLLDPVDARAHADTDKLPLVSPREASGEIDLEDLDVLPDVEITLDDD